MAETDRISQPVTVDISRYIGGFARFFRKDTGYRSDAVIIQSVFIGDAAVGIDFGPITQAVVIFFPVRVIIII